MKFNVTLHSMRIYRYHNPLKILLIYLRWFW